jgi:hypothetical protein
MFQHPISKRAFAVIDVSNDAEITNILGFDLCHANNNQK